jgi:hypothetical protein
MTAWVWRWSVRDWARAAPTLLAILTLGVALVWSLVGDKDGTLRLVLVAAISGLGGYTLRNLRGG